MSLDVDGTVQVVPEPEILVRALGNGRVRGRIHIGHDHGVVRTLRNLQLRQQNRIVERGGYLADAAAHTVHHLIVHKGARHVISVLRGKRRHAVKHGELVPGIQDCAVDQFTAIGYIFASVKVGGTIGCGKGTQYIFHFGKLLGVPPGLCHLHYQRNTAGLAVPSAGQKLVDLVKRCLHIQRVARVPAYYTEFVILPDQRGVHRFHIVLGAFLYQDIRKPLKIKRKFQGIDQILPL